MKNRKKQFLKIGIAVLVIAVAGTVAGVVRYRIDNRFDLTVGGHTISKDEYVNCMKSVEYDTKMQIQQDYDAVYEDGFWEKKYDVSDSSYKALEKRWKDENAKRSEKVEKGEVVYGLKEYTFQLYLQYEMSTLKEKYCNDDTREGMELTEDEVLEYYNSREWIFGDSEENADLETARIAVERELREKKYDIIITQRETDSQVDGNMADVNRFTLKNIE